LSNTSSYSCVEFSSSSNNFITSQSFVETKEDIREHKHCIIIIYKKCVLIENIHLHLYNVALSPQEDEETLLGIINASSPKSNTILQEGLSTGNRYLFIYIVYSLSFKFNIKFNFLEYRIINERA
jgi:hypothetical protein